MAKHCACKWSDCAHKAWLVWTENLFGLVSGSGYFVLKPNKHLHCPCSVKLKYFYVERDFRKLVVDTLWTAAVGATTTTGFSLDSAIDLHIFSRSTVLTSASFYALVAIIHAADTSTETCRCLRGSVRWEGVRTRPALDFLDMRRHLRQCAARTAKRRTAISGTGSWEAEELSCTHTQPQDAKDKAQHKAKPSNPLRRRKDEFLVFAFVRVPVVVPSAVVVVLRQQREHDAPHKCDKEEKPHSDPRFADRMRGVGTADKGQEEPHAAMRGCAEALEESGFPHRRAFVGCDDLDAVRHCWRRCLDMSDVRKFRCRGGLHRTLRSGWSHRGRYLRPSQ